MIQVENLTKDYGSRRAIDNLTFDAKQGEIVGFLGPNGAGKTTTMRILSGYMPPTSGNAKVAGFDVVAESLERRKLSSGWLGGKAGITAGTARPKIIVDFPAGSA